MSSILSKIFIFAEIYENVRQSDKGIANIFQIVKLADYYGISVDELIGRDFTSGN